MPTKNPRLSITLAPSLAAQLREISTLTGNSQSSLVTELLEGSAPVFARVIKVLQAAKDIKEEMRTKFTSELDESQAQIEAQLGLALGSMDRATRPLLEEAEKVRRRAKRSGAASGVGGPTPISNRGVRNDQTLKIKSKKGAKS